MFSAVNLRDRLSGLRTFLFSSKFWLPGLFLILIFCYAYRPLAESDSFYHLKVGELIWQTGEMPYSDVFSYTAYGSFWVPHEWLAELIFYGVWSVSGFWGLIGFCSLLASASFFLIYRMMLQRGVEHHLGSLLLFVLGYLALELWVPRPQTFAYFSFVSLLYCLEQYRRRQELKYLYLAVGVIWFWANTNASFILGIVVLGWYFVSSFLAQRYSLEDSFNSGPRARNIFLTLAASVAISLINPSGYHAWLYSWYIAPTVKALDVFEWRPVWRYFYEFETKVFIAELAASVFFVLWYMGWRKESRDWTLLGLVLGISILPFISIRHVGFWPLVAILPLSITISSLLSGLMESMNKKRIVLVLGIVGLAMLAGRILVWPRIYFDPNQVPSYAADFIEQNNIKGPLAILAGGKSLY